MTESTEKVDDDISNREEQTRFAEESDSLWRLTFPPVIWAVHFVACYGGAAFYCAKFGDELLPVPFLRQSIAGLTILCLAGILYAGWRSWVQWDYLDDYDWEHPNARGEDRHEFLGHAAVLLAIISFIGVCYTAMPAIFMETCR